MTDRLQFSWKKSPRNPLNQVSIAHNASADEERQFAESIRSAVLDSMKVSK